LRNPVAKNVFTRTMEKVPKIDGNPAGAKKILNKREQIGRKKTNQHPKGRRSTKKRLQRVQSPGGVQWLKKKWESL
jgi:hypothetical protein